MHLGFRGKLFVSAFGVAAVALLLAATVVSLSIRERTQVRIEQGLLSEARLVADILEHHPGDVTPETLDAEADRIGGALPARVTLIRADGTVVGDSMVSTSGLASLENHSGRPEVVEATRSGSGSSRRYSHTIGTDMLYVAVAVRHPLVATVRLALPLREVDQQVKSVSRGTLLALAVALVGAGALASLASVLLGRRLDALAAAARRYAGGDLSQPVRDYEDDQVGTVARALDEIVRQLAVRVSELAADRARLNAILSGMLEGVIVVDTLGHVQLANRAARSLLGLGEEVPTGVHYLEAVRHPGVASLLAAALEGRQPPGVEVSPTRAPERVLLARSAPIPAAAGLDGAVLVLHDITELRRADRMRRDFVANVSHELRTPLTAIRGYAEALSDASEPPEARARFAQIIQRHASRMERLVSDLLRLASLDARQETAEWGACAMQDLLEGVAADLGPAAEARHQRIEISVDPKAATLTTDAAKLQAALRNLVENAINYSPEGKRILVEAVAEDGWAAVRVSDEGPGIPEADMERIFERFYRVDKARSRESGGTGLGLSIVKHLVDLLGGRVEVANRRGGGAVFTVRLPLEAPGATANREIRATPSSSPS